MEGNNSLCEPFQYIGHDLLREKDFLDQLALPIYWNEMLTSPPCMCFLIPSFKAFRHVWLEGHLPLMEYILRKAKAHFKRKPSSLDILSQSKRLCHFLSEQPELAQ